MNVKDIDWHTWDPGQRATILFVIHAGNILLIHKKRGLGAGKINGPGGRLEPGETALQAAIRETQEEVGITPVDVETCGELFFQFIDGLSIHVSVFKTGRYTGDLIETDEALPFWCALDAIPYTDMWQDDEYWLPLLLDNVPFKGYFVFDESTMLDHRLDTEGA